MSEGQQSGRWLPWLIALICAGGAVWITFKPAEVIIPENTNKPPETKIGKMAANFTIKIEDPNDYFKGIVRPGYITLPRTNLAATLEAPEPFGTGAATCGECHADKLKGASATSHFHTSQVLTNGILSRMFEADRATMQTKQPGLTFRMYKENGRHYQAVLWKDEEVHRAPIDLIFGSGKLGFTFSYWQGEELFELPVSYLTASDSWVNSPGYPDGTALYSRPIIQDCLTCHATHASAFTDDPQSFRFKQRMIVAGITCERCHGDGRKHVAYHRTNPDASDSKFIRHPGKLERSQLNQLCSECHGGLGDETDEKPGVHSNNQIQRLAKSACFTKSGGMRCTDCHNPHQLERGNQKLFAERCQTCHQVEDCGDFKPARREQFATNCASCHMERMPLLDIAIEKDGNVVYPELVDHFIRVIKKSEN